MALLEAPAAAVVAAEVEPVLLQGLLDLLDRLLAEVRDRGELVLGLHDEVADRLDADPLEAVVRADAELELLDREVLHPVRGLRLGAHAVGDAAVGVAEALHLLDVREDRELADQDLRRLAEGVLRVDRAVGRDVERELVVVGALADTGRLDLVGHAANRREDRVDRDDADRVLRPAVELRRDVAASAADRQRHLEPAVAREVGDLELRIEDLELCRRLDVGRRDGARALLRDVHLDLGGLALETGHEVLQVQDDVGDVLAHARQGRELVRGALDLDRGDRSALERREQHAAQRVAERVAEAAIERLDDEDPAMLVHFLVHDLRDLKVHNACRQRNPFLFFVTSNTARR